MYENDSYLNL